MIQKLTSSTFGRKLNASLLTSMIAVITPISAMSFTAMFVLLPPPAIVPYCASV